METQTDSRFTTTMCLEGKHHLCDGDLRHDNWSKPRTCQCECHNKGVEMKTQPIDKKILIHSEARAYCPYCEFPTTKGQGKELSCPNCGGKYKMLPKPFEVYGWIQENENDNL